MKASLSLLVLLVIPITVNAYIPDVEIAFSAEQLAVGNILVASEDIQGGVLARSVVLLIRHDPDGDMGLVINKPSPYRVEEVYPGLVFGDKAGRLFVGGPVMNAALSALIKTRDVSEGFTEILPGLMHRFVDRNDSADRYMSSDIKAVRFYSGYAGWGRGQLVDEINRGGWYVIDGDPADVFDVDAETLWPALMRKAKGR